MVEDQRAGDQHQQPGGRGGLQASLLSAHDGGPGAARQALAGEARGGQAGDEQGQPEQDGVPQDADVTGTADQLGDPAGEKECRDHRDRASCSSDVDACEERLRHGASLYGLP